MLKPEVAVKLTVAPAQIELSFGVPEFSAALKVPVGNAFTVITTGAKVLVQPEALVAATAIICPFVMAVLL